MSGPEHTWISVAEALSLIESRLPAPSFETIVLPDALGRVLAEDVIARESLPRQATSAMDGYGVRAAEVAGASDASPRSLPLAGEVAAGGDPHVPWPKASCLRVLTGARIPPGCDGVIPVEETSEEGTPLRVHFRADLEATGSNIRPAGEDLAAGEAVLPRGTVLRPRQIALLAALGEYQFRVTGRVRVGFLATGDELVPASEEPGPNRIRNSNSPLMSALLAAGGAQPLDLGVAPDDPAGLRDLLADAATRCDAILTSGGVSAGVHDHVASVLVDLGAEWVFHRVAQQPAKPLAFLVLDGLPVFALPGNPVSTFMAYWFYAGPALKKMMGQTDAHPRQVTSRLTGKVRGRESKTFFARAHTRWNGDHYESTPTPPHGSHILSSLSRANSFLVLPPGTPTLDSGDSVTAAFFEEAT